MPITDTSIQTLVKEATRFPDLELRLEYLPAVIPQTVAVEETAAALADQVDTSAAMVTMPVEDTYVPDYVQQRLLYYWTRYGPKWVPDTITENNDPVPLEEIPFYLPYQAVPQLRADDRRSYDGVRRKLKVRL